MTPLKKQMNSPFLYIFTLIGFVHLHADDHAHKDKIKQKEDSTQTSRSENIKNYLTVYSDIALIEKIEEFHLEKDDQKICFKDIPNEIIEQSIFLNTDDKNLTLLESYLDENNDQKNLYVTFNNNQEGVKTNISLTYATQNITWSPSYTAEFSKNYNQLTIEGWINVKNDTTANFKSTHLTISDGKSTILPEPDEATELTDPKNKTNERYKIETPINLKAKSTKRFNWIRYQDLQTSKEYRLNVGGLFLEDQTNKNNTPPLELWINCSNKEKPLPKGPLIIYKKNEENQKQALTKMVLPFVKSEETMSFKMPELMNDCKPDSPIKIAYEQTEFQRFTGKIVETANRITLQNITDHPVSVKIFIDFPTSDGVVLRESIPHQTSNDKNFFWVVEIPVNEKIDLKYRLRFSQKC
jgi:hypothetical protein